MSAFLGPIHTWLYNKIKFQDELTTAIINEAIKNGYDDVKLCQVDKKYGALEKGNLEDLIDVKNIHGWLQEQITLVENRLAFVVTVLTDENPERILTINDAVYEFGKEHAVESGITVKEAYQYLEALLLNGMPCDRVNEIVSETDEKLVWNQTSDIHKQYWTMIHGNGEFYYSIRESLIIGIFENSGIEFEQISDQTFELRKEA